MAIPKFLVVFAALLALGAEAAVYPNGMCWKAAELKIRFNPALDPNLENPGKMNPPYPSVGAAADRVATMQKAIDAWNRELLLAGATLRLSLDLRPGAPAWAAGQSKSTCQDPDGNELVYEADYRMTHPDGTNAGSTGRDDMSRANNLGPGWIQGGACETDKIDQRLAETALSPAPNDARARLIQEADITYFTHFNEGKNCSKIRWNYAALPVGPAPGPYYDFYSVMMHEIGHLLGLDHDNCFLADNKGNRVGNVMQASIRPGERKPILGCDRKSLVDLYGPKGACFVPPLAGGPAMAPGKKLPAPLILRSEMPGK